MTRPRALPLPVFVHRVTPLSDDLVRIELTAPDWSGFAEPTHADSYVKLVFLTPGVDYPRPIDPARIRAELPAAAWPRTRTYTIRAFDRAAATLTLDVVTHGTAGLAGPWARSAVPGDEALISGPGGGYSPDAGADWHLLAGDESALPAIAVALERLPGQARGAAFIEISGPSAELDLAHPAGFELSWLHRGGAQVGEAIVSAVRAWDLPPGNGQCFVHGEAGFVKDLRRYLRIERDFPLDRLSISGYWRLGADDEAWRAIKREWNADIDAAESRAVASDVVASGTVPSG